MSHKDKIVLYFAYGLNHYPEMIKAIIGRQPYGWDYDLKGYELCIQSWKDIPNLAQKILKTWWDKSFKSYSIRKKSSKFVHGRIWKLTKEERALVGNWELHNLWYRPIVLKRKLKGHTLTIETEMILNNAVVSVDNKRYYPPFPVNKKKILMVARKVRKDYLKNS